MNATNCRAAWRAVLLLLSAVATSAVAQFSNTDAGVTRQTQVQGYWVDPSNKLMWAGKDNGKRVSWHKAAKYCRDLRLAGYSDWRLATIDELEGLVNLRAYATERVGSVDYLHWNGDLHVNGGLELTGDRQWSGSPLLDVRGRPEKSAFWYFDFREGRREKGLEDIAEGEHMRALCVRASDTIQAPEAQPSAYWFDKSTGLSWAANDNGKDVNLGEAISYCRDLRLAQSTDWRLATIEELDGIAKRLPQELSLTGNPWSGSAVSDERGFSPSFVWFLNRKSRTRLFDQPSYRRDKRALCVRNAGQTSAQETQQRGYWVDPSTGLMWEARDNLQNFILYSEATKYCRDLRLAHYSDWRLATTEELQGIYDQKEESPGANPRAKWHEPEAVFFHVKGDLFLSGMQWATPSKNDGGNSGEWVFDFQEGKLVNDEQQSIRGKRALCVRRSVH